MTVDEHRRKTKVKVFGSHRFYRFLVLLVLVTTTSGWIFHNRLTKSTPEKDDVLTEAPQTIQLWFAEEPELVLSSVTLKSADNAKVALDKLRKAEDAKSVTAPITGPIRPGSFTVEWKTAGKDGHVIRGKYSFTLKP
jgi:hypothetical protein